MQTLLELLLGTRGVNLFVHEYNYADVVAMLATEEFGWVPVETSEFVKQGQFILRDGNWTHNGRLNSLLTVLGEESKYH